MKHLRLSEIIFIFAIETKDIILSKMRRCGVLLAILFFTLASTMYAQRYPSELDKIKVSFKKYLNGYYLVDDGFSHRNYQGKVIKGDIGGLFEGDVMKYYQLDRKYDSPLKLKMFKQSKEYQTLLACMEKEREFLLADTFYIVSKIAKTDYDLERKAFFFPVSADTEKYQIYYYGYDYSPRLGIVTPLLTKRGVKVGIEDEDIALQVENNYQDCRLILIFTFDDELSEKDEECPIGRMHKLLLVNVKTGKVYYYGRTSSKSKPKNIKLTQYDHDIYVQKEEMNGEEYPVAYYLKVGDRMIELDQDDPMPVYDEYKIEIEDNAYFAIDKYGERHLLSFKPIGILLSEKDADYDAKCGEIAKDYKQHPENYQDLGTDYVDLKGNIWSYQSDFFSGRNELEKENVYMLDDKFIRKLESTKVEDIDASFHKDVDTKVFDVVEQMPSFPGGQTALISWLASNIKYPAISEENGVQGHVVCSFIVERDGSLSDIKVRRSVDPALDKEAIRVLKTMPKWFPGKEKGIAVRVQYTFPVTFKLQ